MFDSNLQYWIYTFWELTRLYFSLKHEPSFLNNHTFVVFVNFSFYGYQRIKNIWNSELVRSRSPFKVKGQVLLQDQIIKYWPKLLSRCR